jgi:hypothetical protein
MVNHYLTPGAIIDSNNTWNGDIQTFSNGLTIGLAASAPAPDNNAVHIWNGESNRTAISNSLLVLEGPVGSDIGLTFLTGNSGVGRIQWGDGSDAAAGRIDYDHSVDRFAFVIDGTARLMYTAETFDFREPTAISTNSGELTLTPATHLVLNSVNAGVTADTGSSQGDGAITKSITQISVCASAGDAVTLPTAVAGTIIMVMNDGAEAADVFPASSDNINEAGANTAYSLAVNKNAMFIAHDATHWSVILTA